MMGGGRGWMLSIGVESIFDEMRERIFMGG
jgi:hypothetical protein